VTHTIRIKKYPNRRLYDTGKSVYITLQDVSESIKKGHRIEVVDVKTGEDVTAFVLTQIIMNKAKEADSLLPVSLLHLVIQYGENILHDFFDSHLEKTMKNYLEYRKAMDDQVHAYLEMGMDFSNLAEKTLKELDPMRFFSAALGNNDDKK
jgi:polyhydroxyalkanoate synthesis repressor PhaR